MRNKTDGRRFNISNIYLLDNLRKKIQILQVGIVSCFNRFDLICSINFNWFIDYMKYTFWSEMVGFELEQYLGKYN